MENTAPPDTTHPPDILLAEDDPEDQEIFCWGMQDLYPRVKVQVFDNGSALLKYLKDYPFLDPPKCILIDNRLRDFSGPDILQAIGFITRFSTVPKIVMSTLAMEKEIEECLNLGATRFIIKAVSYSDQKKFLQSLYSDFIEVSPDKPDEQPGEVTA